MTKQEAAKLIYVIKAAYPQHYKSFGQNDLANIIQVWENVLDGYSYEQASAGLTIFLRTDSSGFPPAPGQVIDCIHRMDPVEGMTAAQAWALVSRAISNSSYHAAEEWEHLPEICRKALGSVDSLREMAQLPIDTVQSVEKSHFIRAFNTCLEREKHTAKLPPVIRERLIGYEIDHTV